MQSRAAIKSHPIHPMLVAFPIGLFVTSFIFDVASVLTHHPSLFAPGWYCIAAGLIASLGAAVPGVIDLFSVVPPNSSGRSRGYRHALLNGCAVVLFLIVCIRRFGPNAWPDTLSLALSGAGVVVLGFSGWLGGTLVYRNQIGVDHRYANAGKSKLVELDRWDAPVCEEKDLLEGQLVLANIAGARVAVGRCPEGIVAFSDRCTHKGGPLSDGALVGCTVQCPWHGSQFNVHTGAVVNGPAEERIEAFTAEVEAGKVFVRPKHGHKREAA